ncbi:MAG: GNAT family N-acetyltransferase [Gemmobacter sp.]
MQPSSADLFAALEATWPAAAVRREGDWLIRDGQGGGKRVSAATAAGPGATAQIGAMESAQAALGQPSLVMIRPGDGALDTALADRGYRRVDPTVLLAIAAGSLRPPAPMTTFPVWPPFQVIRDLWAEAGIGPARQAVMERSSDPRCAIMGRAQDRVAGAGFVAVARRIAMMHALEVRPDFRRQGTADNIMRRACIWAQDHAADWLCVAVTEANTAARALYASLGLRAVDNYHYRMR